MIAKKEKYRRKFDKRMLFLKIISFYKIARENIVTVINQYYFNDSHRIFQNIWKDEKHFYSVYLSFVKRQKSIPV